MRFSQPDKSSPVILHKVVSKLWSLLSNQLGFVWLWYFFSSEDRDNRTITDYHSREGNLRESNMWLKLSGFVLSRDQPIKMNSECKEKFQKWCLFLSFVTVQINKVFKTR